MGTEWRGETNFQLFLSDTKQRSVVLTVSWAGLDWIACDTQPQLGMMSKKLATGFVTKGL